MTTPEADTRTGPAPVSIVAHAPGVQHAPVRVAREQVA